ncbi:MAG: 1-deoxy-D-xylulose-5-phosphate reductoisomerase [Oscillospiraceae bacterium]|jgi:1-deoxy-D-xylulose-5-phosphate reductoisomerase|nr:1-deoxy-D-xylulose-5-phosphate reductoisomerase [Oscillospiraceae bacterium]
MTTITILGSTGSIGRQTLEVAEHLGYKIKALTAYNNAELLEQQTEIFKPEIAVLGTDPNGQKEITDIAKNSGADIIVTAISGIAGLEPTLAAVKTGKRVALANKEPLVCAGDILMQMAKEFNTEIIPVDSEHSAIFQCINGNFTPCISNDLTKSSLPQGLFNIAKSQVKKIILTASGGPFRGYTKEQLSNVTPEDALIHPNWDMGKKITIDSATLMNKGLELIEAMYLFSISPEQIEVVIHPESIIHSMVEFVDGSTIAQLSNPDMRIPIQYALTYPNRLPGLAKPLDLTALGKLTFEKPNIDLFPCLRLAIEAAKKGTKYCANLNQANEEAVALFLVREIKFLEISEYIEAKLNS